MEDYKTETKTHTEYKQEKMAATSISPWSHSTSHSFWNSTVAENWIAQTSGKLCHLLISEWLTFLFMANSLSISTFPYQATLRPYIYSEVPFSLEITIVVVGSHLKQKSSGCQQQWPPRRQGSSGCPRVTPTPPPHHLDKKIVAVNNNNKKWPLHSNDGVVVDWQQCEFDKRSNGLSTAITALPYTWTKE